MLGGAAEALREAIGSVLSDLRGAEWAQQLAVARAALGEEAFAAAWAAGRRMTLEQATDFAANP